MSNQISVALVAIVVLGLIFLVCRELVCWYWKINKTTELLEDILVELRASNGKHRKVE